MNFITNNIIKRNFTNLAKNNKLKSFEWKRISSIDLKLDQDKNVKNRKTKTKTKKREIKNIRFSDYDYYSI